MSIRPLFADFRAMDALPQLQSKPKTNPIEPTETAFFNRYRGFGFHV